MLTILIIIIIGFLIVKFWKEIAVLGIFIWSLVVSVVLGWALAMFLMVCELFYVKEGPDGQYHYGENFMTNWAYSVVVVIACFIVKVCIEVQIFNMVEDYISKIFKK